MFKDLAACLKAYLYLHDTILFAVKSLSPLIFLVLALVNGLYGQSCFNSNFEQGDAGAYSTFTGRLETGVPIIDQIEYDTNRHRIMRVDEGLDPVVENLCQDLDLPVVSPSGGAYSMRLGNSWTGSEAESVSLRFTVDEQSTFFLLQYAVVMEDPSHTFDDQPRFELNIKRTDGEPVECGSYVVRADEELEGFESCGILRVRPWTTVGIELQSYLGEEIIIEILTTDCGRGGHFGYAYFDATCQPLSIEVVGYCEEADSAIVRVTEGFVDYLWDTGDTTSSIVDYDPVEGEVYNVTVTSATGCTLVLSDTLPPIEEVLDPVFQGPFDSVYCGDPENFNFRPIVSDASSIYSLFHGYAAEQFPIDLELDTSYQFYAANDYGCLSDTVTYRFSTVSPEPDFIVTAPYCRGEATGRIEVVQNPTDPAYEVLWENGETGLILENVATGIHKVIISKDEFCDAEFFIEVPEADGFVLDYRYSASVCGDQATAFIQSSVINASLPVMYSFNGGAFEFDGQWNNLGPGEYVVVARDAANCVLRDTFSIGSRPSPTFLNDVHEFESCDTFITIVPEVDFADRISWVFGRIDSALEVNTVNFSEVIIEANFQSCKTLDTFYFNHLGPLIEGDVDHLLCYDDSSGVITITDLNDDPSLEYDWGFSRENRITDLAAGTYAVTLTNAAQCTAFSEFLVRQPDSLQLIISSSSTQELCVNDSTGIVFLSRRGGSWPIEFSIDGVNFSSQSRWDSLPAGEYTFYARDRNDCMAEVSYRIEEVPTPLYEGEDLILLCERQAFFEVLFSDASRVYSEYHDAFGSSFLIDLDVEDSYRFIGYNRLNCPSDTVEISFMQRDSPRVEVLVADNLCFGDATGRISLTVPMDANVPYTYLWDDMSIDSVLSELQSGAYSVTVTDRFMCEATYTYQVTSPARLMGSHRLINGNSCEGQQDGEIELQASGGVEPYLFLLSDGQEDFLGGFSELSAGIYMYSVRDSNGCVFSDSFDIKEVSIDSFELQVSPETCDLDNGAIVIGEVFGGLGANQYGINMDALGEISEFVNLDSGSYLIRIRDSLGCQIEQEVLVQRELPVSIIRSEVVSTSCDEPNGELRLELNFESGTRSFLMDQELFSLSVDGLEPGAYTWVVEDSNGCSDSLSFDIDGSEPLEIVDVDIQEFPCISRTADIELFPNRDIAFLDYSIDGSVGQSEAIFMDVPEGDHLISIVDSNGCQALLELDLQLVEMLSVEPLLDGAECDNSGQVFLDPSGGIPPYMYSSDSVNWYGEGDFENLAPGVQLFYVRDDSDCFQEVFVDIPFSCEVYFPTVFSPNGDAVNDVFKPYLNDEDSVTILRHQIFDRWGNMVFSSVGVPVSQYDAWWNGSWKSQPAPVGVYTYVVDLLFVNGERLRFDGDFTLIR